MNKDNFSFWLESHTTLSLSAINKYTGAINTISKGLEKKGLLMGSLYDINDPVVVENLTLKYFSIGEFEEKDIRGNRMYSNALKYYKKYVEEV
ncbi:hypothetical protein [Planomicrobium okeanokoites]|uniref:hypothetical protein n=1 Tax=Planomicrobium okeanokoites TaxID=244 RepID=UPI0030F94C76